MSRIRILAIAVLAIVAVAACQGAPAETPTTSLDLASATSPANRA
jgi:hypothetical protein